MKTIPRIPRPIVTWLLRIYGFLSLFTAVFYTGLLVFVPLVGLENAAWERADNPVTAANAILAGAIGAGCLALAKASNRTRIWVGAAVFVTALGYGLFFELN